MKDVRGGFLRELRDGILVLTVHKAGLCGGSSVVEKSGHIRIVVGRVEMNGQGMGDELL